ncbi:hypothetical protein ACFZCF_03825 [Streptomyces sp. NPDC007945]|uniref:hypothetical protein n=1 Tax=Streptomyces sp. NPDC007945 TaxID=3364797 RepID=UPI0036E3AB69
MNTENPGCLTGVARAVALVVVLPFRLLWDALAWCGRQLRRRVLAPIGRAVGWLLHLLLVVPLQWLSEWVLAPIGRAVGWLLHLLLVVPLRWLWEWVLVPVGRALWWLVDLLLVTPLRWLWRHALGPACRVVGAVLSWAWRVAGGISRAVGRALRYAIVRPLARVYRTVLTPVGHGLRRYVGEPVAAAARAVRAAAREARTALFGGVR